MKMIGFRAQMGKYIFKDCWLDGTVDNGDNVRSYITKVGNYSVKCTWCSLTIQTDNAGRSGIVKHYKSKGHKRIAEAKSGRIRGQLLLG